MRNVSLTLVFLCALATRLGAINYYVDFVGGADENHGTGTDGAWKHCPGDPAAGGRAAVCVLVRGDVVVFKGGVTYVLGGAFGIALRWSGEPGKPITYDGNSAGEWGEGRAKFSDNHGAAAITAFAATEFCRHLVFKTLEIGPIGGAVKLPADEGSPVAPRFGGGIALTFGCQDIAITDCAFRDLGYAFNEKPMNAASIAGAAVKVSGSVRDLTISRCEFNRMAFGLDLVRTSSISGVAITDSTFGEAIVWPLNLAGMEGTLGNSMVSVRDTKLDASVFFDAPKWTGYDASPRVDRFSVPEGGSITLVASALASPAAKFTWYKGETLIGEAVEPWLRLANVTKDAAAIYSAVATNSEGSAKSNSAVLVVTDRPAVTDGEPRPTQFSPVSQSTAPPPPPLPAPAAPPTSDTESRNPAVRVLSQFEMRTLAGDVPAATVAFAVDNNAPRQVLIRASGPTLAVLGMQGALGDPQLELFRGKEFLASNDDWGGRDDIMAAVNRLGIFPFASTESKDAAVLVSLPGGDYRVVAKDAEAKGGLVLIEIRELP